MLVQGTARQLKNTLVTAVVSLAVGLASCAGVRAETLRTGGTGAALVTLRLLGAAFAKTEPDIVIEVVEGLGSSGAMAAVAAGALDFCVSGRPPGDADDRSLRASILARSPIGFVSSHPSPGDIRVADLSDLFGSATSVWPDGKPVRVVLRPKNDSDSSLLASTFPEMSAAIEKVRARPEVPVAATDQDNARLAQALPDSLAFMTLMQLQTEKLRLRFLTIDGVAPTLANFQSGKYPYGKILHLVVSSRNSPARDRFLAFVRSPVGEAVLRENGSLPGAP